MSSFWMPKKQPLYAPMLSTLGGGSARGFGHGVGGGGSTLGLTASEPAINALAILADDPQRGDGWYYIKTSNMANAELVWCDMTTDGGGYMLTSYQPNCNTRQWFYPNRKYNYPTGMTAGSSTFGVTQEFTLPVQEMWFNGTPGSTTAICSTSMKMVNNSNNNALPTLSNMDLARKVVYTTPADLNINTGSNIALNGGWTAATNALPGTWTPLKGFTQMTSSVSVQSTPDNWLYSTSGYWTDCGPSSDSQLNSGNGQGTGSWTAMNASGTGTNIYGMKDVDYTESGDTTAIIDTAAHFIR